MDESMIADLARSGLTPEDIGARAAGSPDYAAIRVPNSSQGYVIPYYQPNGERMQFYRVKLLNHELKYKQPNGTPNHVYYPKTFQQTLINHIKRCRAENIQPYILLTEGEKKAAASCKAGLPCVALGGVDSWRNRTIVLPPESELDSNYSKQGSIRVKLPKGVDVSIEDFTLATGMKEFVNMLIKYKLALVLVYDTDESYGLKFDVQRAASALGYQIAFMGVPIQKIRQLVLPYGVVDGGKVGLDDYLMAKSPRALNNLCVATMQNKSSFPRHPNPKAYVNLRLQKGRMSRKEMQELALVVTTELDARGRRLHSKSESKPYYFDEVTHKLMPAQMLHKNGEPLHESTFGRFLYQEYGISNADGRLFQWLASQFTGEEPVSEVEPKRILAIPPGRPDEIALQISDSHFAVVSGNPDKPLTVYTNGSYGLLFEQDQVAATEASDLEVAFEELSEEDNFPCWWLDIFKNKVNMQVTENDQDVTTLAALLFYISPYLLRWRGTQLPIEIILGEAGSGKSSLYELRLSILTGEPLLRNIPTDLRDWFSSIVNTGGLHVTDNVQFTNKELRQRLSDEMCRIITEPRPHIEMRKLFTTSTHNQLPVNTVFAMTAIQQPFFNADLIQRAAIFELHAIGSGHDSNWVQTQLNRFGGRTKWLAHHLLFLHKFLALVREGNWNQDYKAEHRLANYEQSLSIAAKVFGIPFDNLPEQLIRRTRQKIEDADWTLSAIKEYAEEMLRCNPKGVQFQARDITAWAEAHEVHATNPQLQNGRKLGQFMVTHQTMLFKITGIKLTDPTKNNEFFEVRPSENS